MTQLYRLPAGGRIDRKKALEFSFQGQRYQGFRGDTLASALLANGVRVVGRSFKYHRPRGIVGSGAEEPNAILQIGRGARTLPNIRATQAELYEGLDAYNITAWPTLDFDLKALYGAFGKLLPAGFYYKTFMWPRKLWHTYERTIRSSAGLGLAPDEPDPDYNVPANYGRQVWEAVMAAGKEFDITPYGTEAMHVLRAEKGYIIIGQETDGSVTPVDLGLESMLGSKEFLGRRSLKRPDGLRSDRKQLIGLKSQDGKTVLPEGGQIIETPETRTLPVPMLGHVTSSYWSANLGRPIALALVKGGRQRLGQPLFVAAGDRPLIPVEVVSPVFLDPEGARQNV